MTVQGEGPTTGQRAGFVRLMGCKLHCGFCDSAYTWDARRYNLKTEGHRVPVADICGRALAGDPGIVVITGGEPLLHQRQPGWPALLGTLRDAGAEIEVETSGTVAPSPVSLAGVARWNVSPKLAHAGDPEKNRIRPGILSAFRDTRAASFKFVCRTEADIGEAGRIAAAAGIPPRMVWIMPEGTSAPVVESRLRALAGPAVARGFNLTGRMQVAIWGEERGH